MTSLLISLVLAIAPATVTLDQILDAIAIVESNNNPNAVGDQGRAIGAYQLHKIYVDDVNRIAKTKYKYQDRYDPIKSRNMVALYLMYYGKQIPIHQWPRLHNGGPRGHTKNTTLPYQKKINHIIGEQT